MIYNLDTVRDDLILDIGIQGEDNARQVKFDIRAWLAAWPGGTIEIQYKRPEDTGTYDALPSKFSVVDGILTWIIDINQTVYGGYGYAIITYRQGGVVRKSPRFNTLVKAGLPPAGPAPDAVADWIAEANTSLNAIKTLEFTINEDGELLAGETILGRVSDNPRGDYNPSADPLYSKRDIVFDNGGSYRYINDTPSNEPTSSASHWQQIATMGGQDLVDAAVAARDAAQGYKDAAAASAAQLAAGTASPAGTYANLTALNTANPDHGKIYLTLDDGNWCYHNGTVFVAGGVYQATSDHAEIEAARGGKTTLGNRLDGIEQTVDKIDTALYDSEIVYESVPLTIGTDGYYTNAGVFTSATGRGYAHVEVTAGEVYKLSTRIRPVSISAIVKFNSAGACVGVEKTGTGVTELVVDYVYTVESDVTKIIVQTAEQVYEPNLSLEKAVRYERMTVYTKEETDEKINSGVMKYGVKWSLSDHSDEGQRCFDAIGKTASIGIGATNGESDFDSIYPWSEMKRCNIKTNSSGAVIATFEGDTGFALDGSNGDVFVRIPKFYVERYQRSGYEYRTVSSAGSNIHEAFVENGIELDEIFVGAFEGFIGYDGKLRSIGNVIPTNNELAATFLTAATENGNNYSMYDMRCVDAIWTLMAVEYGKRNSNRVIGWGVSDLYQPLPTGLKVLEDAISTNSIKITYMSPAVKEYMPIGSNLTICNGTQQNIVAQRTIISYVDEGSAATIITFDGDPLDVTTACFVGSAPCDTNWCENSPSPLGWHTGRSNWIAGSATRNPVRYRWIENPVGNLWHFLPDVTFANGQMYVCKNMSDYLFHSVEGGYKPYGEPFESNEDNGIKDDVVNANYWITSLMNDTFVKNVSMARTYDKSLTSVKAFGAYYYMNTGANPVCITNGGGFDHLWRCNMLTHRAWNFANRQWYLYGARMMFKKL